MSGSISNFGGAAPGAQNGLGLNGVSNLYELGGNLTRATIINTSALNTLALTGLVNGNPATDTLLAIDAAGIMRFINVTGLPDFWRSGIGDVLPDGTTDYTDQVSHDGNVGIGITDSSTVRARLDVNGAQILRPVNIANLAAGGAVGTASATVDITSTLVLAQTTASQALTLPSPTNTQAGRLLFVTHNGTAAGTTVGGKLIGTGETLIFVWDGNSWNGNAAPTSADFWRTVTNILPDGTTDTTDSIRRLGHTGIGGALITDVMPTVTTPSATNNFLHLSADAANRAQIMYGSNPYLYYMTRVLPVIVNDYVSIGSWTVSAQASVFTLSVNVSNGAFAASKFYVATMNWDATAGAWRVLKPLSNGGAFNGNDYELLINVAAGVLSLRLRRTAGATVGTARIYLQCYGDPATILTESAATAADATVYTQYDPFGSVDFWRSNAGASLPDGTTDTSEFVSRTGAVGIGSNTQVGTSQLSVVSDSNTITDPIISAQANNLTQGVDLLWSGITKSGTVANGDLGITAKGTGNIVLHASVNGMTASTGNVGVNTATPAAKLDINGAEILRPVVLANFAANGAIGTAAATVDITSFVTIPQTTAGITLTIPNPTNAQSGRLLDVVNTGTQSVTVGGEVIASNTGMAYIWEGAAWRSLGRGASRDWTVIGNAGTTATAYADAAAQANNFMGTTDNQPVAIYTNASSANAKSDLRLYTSTAVGAGVAASTDIFHVRRNGQAGVSNPQTFAIALGKWFADVNGRTRADFRLGNLGSAVDATIMSMFAQGGVVIGLNAANMGWNTATGGIAKNGVGAAMLRIDGTDGRVNIGPHIAITTTADDYPVYSQLNWTHNNVSQIFDGYFDGAWKASHTTRPYAIYKQNDQLRFVGSSTAPAAAGSAWAQDSIMSVRYAGATLAGGELWMSNVAKNRRIVLWDVTSTSDHQFYGLGIGNLMMRYQVDATGSAHRFFAGTSATTSNELACITGGGRLGVGIAAPAAIIHASGANANAATGAPLLKLSDTNIAGSYWAVDNGAVANAYRVIATTNLELQSAGNGNQLFLSTNGGVGIGTAAPVAAAGNISAAGNGFKPGGGAWGVFSDKRIKKEIKPFTPGLKELLALNPITHQYNGKAGFEDNGRTYVSLIAQEVQKIIPEFVEPMLISDDVFDAMSKEDKKLFKDKTILSLKEGLTNFEALIVNSIKSLVEENKRLSDRISKLERS